MPVSPSSSTSTRTAHVLVLAASVPDPWAADPVERTLARAVLRIADARPEIEVTLASGERVRADRLVCLYGQRRIRVVAATERLAADLGPVDAVLVLGALVAARWRARLESVRSDVPWGCLADVPTSARLASLAESFEGSEERAGARAAADIVAVRERTALEAGAVVGALTGAGPALARVASCASVVEIPVDVPASSARPPFEQRDGVVIPVALREWGTPDEEGLHQFLEADGALDVTGPIRMVPLDGRPLLRAHPGGMTLEPDLAWTEAVDLARVAVLPRTHGGPVVPRLCDLATSGLPFVATSEATGGLDLPDECVAEDVEAIAGALEALHGDAVRWGRTQRLLREALPVPGADEHDAALRDLLAVLGVAVEDFGPRRASTQPPAGSRAALTGRGTLADIDPEIGQFERGFRIGPVFDRHRTHHILRIHDLDGRYRLWDRFQERGEAFEAWARREALEWEYRPTVSIVMPMYNTPPDVLRETIASVQAQWYPWWELCICDDASSERDAVRLVRERAARDDRIKFTHLKENQGIAAASNAALGLAQGEHVGLLDHDDLLKPDALFWTVRLLNARPELDVVYSDWDKVDGDGNLQVAYFKPDWSPDLFLEVNHLIHFAVVRRSVLAAVGGWREGFEGSQDYDLLLRVTEVTDQIGHVAKPLYSWRAMPGSTALAIQEKPEADAAGKRALRDALARRGIEADVLPGYMPTHHRVRYRRPRDPLVTIVIPTRDRVDLLEFCIDGIRSSTSYPRYEILIVDNQSEDPRTLAFLAAFEGRVVRYPYAFNYARQMNLALLEVAGDLVLLLNNDVGGFHESWLENLVEHGQRPEVGVVGARLRFPDGRAQHEGITVADLGGVAANVNGGGYFTYGNHTRNCAAVTGACLMTRPDVYWSVGGFDERLRVAWNDVDFCLRVGERGYRVVYTPYTELIHPESASRQSLDPEADRDHYERRWGPQGSLRDPFYNPNLDLLDPFMLRL